MTIEYFVVECTGATARKLIREVNKKPQKEGWNLQGGVHSSPLPAVGNLLWSQALWKECLSGG